MRQLAPGLRSAILRDLARSGLSYGGLKAYFGSANIVPIEAIEPNGFKFRVGDIDNLQRYLAGDFDRFALAAFESFYRSRETGSDLNFYGWRLLESYYASFFAAHALMRALGGGVSHVGRKELASLNDLADLYEVPDFSLSSGSIIFDLQRSGEDWILGLTQSSQGKGVHDAFWRDFCVFTQKKAADAVERGLPDAADFLAGAADLANAITVDGVGTSSWLAKIRNAINYQHEFDVWFPTHKSVSIEFPDRRSGAGAELFFRVDLSRSKEPIELFENVNSRIVHILWDIAELFLSISKRSGQFGSRYARLLAVKS